MSNVAEDMGKPATPVVHPRLGYAYSASKVNTESDINRRFRSDVVFRVFAVLR
jgi:hypothetical protein